MSLTQNGMIYRLQFIENNKWFFCDFKVRSDLQSVLVYHMTPAPLNIHLTYL